MLSGINYAIFATLLFAMYLALTIIVSFSSELGIGWWVVLTILFGLGALINLQCLLRANKRDRILSNIEEIQTRLGKDLTAYYSPTFQYIKEHLK